MLASIREDEADSSVSSGAGAENRGLDPVDETDEVRRAGLPIRTPGTTSPSLGN